MSDGKETKTLKEELILMARTAEQIYEKALSTLDLRSDKAAEDVFQLDEKLDALELTVDTESMRVLALKEPYGIDFRFVFSAVKTTRDLERIGDESKTIAKWSRSLKGTLSSDIKELGGKAKESLNSAVHALVENDVALAEQVLKIELQVDELEDKIMKGSPELPLAMIARAMERVGDLSTNIAENVIFSVKAEDIRHGSFIHKQPKE